MGAFKSVGITNNPKVNLCLQIPIKPHSAFCLFRKGNNVRWNSSLTAGCAEL